MKYIWLLLLVACSSESLSRKLEPESENTAPKLNFDNGYKSNTNPMIEPSGEVFYSPANIYPIWYGNWNQNTIDLTRDFLSNFGNSDYHKINTQYYQIKYHDNSFPKITYVTDKFTVMPDSFDDFSEGIKLTSDSIFDIIKTNIDNHNVNLDPNGIYLVMTDKTVSVTDSISMGFCRTNCGWHNNKVYKNVNLVYIFIGDPNGCQGCSTKRNYINHGFDHSPNFNWGADSLINILTHELSESVTDPYSNYSPFSSNLPGWRDVNGLETADKCAWIYGDLYVTDTFSVANIRVGTKDYLVQQNFVLHTNKCALHIGE